MHQLSYVSNPPRKEKFIFCFPYILENEKRHNNIDIKTVLRIVICGHFKNSHAKVEFFYP